MTDTVSFAVLGLRIAYNYLATQCYTRMLFKKIEKDKKSNVINIQEVISDLDLNF